MAYRAVSALSAVQRSESEGEGENERQRGAAGSSRGPAPRSFLLPSDSGGAGELRKRDGKLENADDEQLNKDGAEGGTSREAA